MTSCSADLYKVNKITVMGKRLSFFMHEQVGALFLTPTQWFRSDTRQVQCFQPLGLRLHCLHLEEPSPT